MCTIASMPRLPEHCIEYVRMLQWSKEQPFGGNKPNYIRYLFIYVIHLDNYFKKTLIYIYMFLSSFPFFSPLIEGVPLDGDDPDHIQWIFQKSLERASQFNIRGVTYRLTQGKLVNCRGGR